MGLCRRRSYESTGSRAVLTPHFASLARNLSPHDKVHIVVPTAFSVSSSSGDFIPSENIEYVWEVLETGAGTLMAVPVPIAESLGRAPLPCPCAGINGRCSYLKFCFETLPYIKCTMTLMHAEDPKLCITLKAAESGVPEINFASSYVVMKNGQEMTVTIFGRASGLWEQKRAWASVYQEGIGCFLEDIHDIGPADLEGSRAQLHNLTMGQVLESPFEFGIKEKGVR